MIESFLIHLRKEENVRSSNVYHNKYAMGKNKE